jgi:hypothetical protein
MYLSNRLYVITGLVLIAIAICFLIGGGVGMAVSSTDPTSKADTKNMLQDINDHHTLAVISTVLSVLLDSALTLAISGLTYLVFRDRSRLLATTFLIAFIGSSVLSSVTDGINASTIVLAKDFVHSGAGLNAGDPAILELTHVLQTISSLVGSWGGTMLAIAFLTLGWLIARGPAGNVNPPKPIGWIIIVAGIASAAGWAQFATGAIGFLSFIVFAITTFIFTIWLGIWLITNSSKLPLPDGAAA